MLGVNLAGGEFGRGNVFGTNYTYPTTQELDYYAAKGMDVIRVPFKIERVMPTKTGELNMTDVNRLKAIVDTAETKGLSVVLDAHNYGRAWGSLIGTGTTTNAEFANFWGKMAAVFKDDPNVMFGLMNEPNVQSATNWVQSNNAAIAAIREAGATQKILVPGSYWTGAHAWINNDNDTVIGLGTVDPLNNFAFEVHQYLDSDSSGTTANTVSATIGSERLKAITDWARANNKDLFLGEFGAANTATGLAALDDMTNFMDDNTDVWIGATAWAGGPWWKPDYHFLLEPADIKTKGVAATDRPQVDVLEKYDLAAGTVPPVDPPVVVPDPPVVVPEPPVVVPGPPVVVPPVIPEPLPPILVPEPPILVPEPPIVVPESPVHSRTWPGRENYHGDHDGWLL